MKILVTGGTGRIGANLVTRLLDKGHDVRSLVYPGDASRAHKLDAYANVETVTGDLRNLEDVRNAVKGVDAVYHIAAAFGGPFDNRQYLDINAMGTLNLLESVRTECPNLHRFVYACTEAVYWKLEDYGRYFEEPVTEDMVARYHHMPYFLTKWIGEELAMTYYYQYQVPSTSFRFSTVIEPSEFFNDAGIPMRLAFSSSYERYKSDNSDDPDTQAILDDLRAKWTDEDQLLLSRNPNGVPHKQHFCDVRDIARGLLLGIEKEEAVGEEFTLGGAAIIDWGVAVPWLAERYGLTYADARLPEANYFTLDLTKIKTRLGFQPKHDLVNIVETAEAIRRGEQTDVVPTGVRYGEG
ncbi:MAG: NAD(P)-dependent oxidoreductase [Caldilineaceae bacterium SB0662_bin_25]|nr:NAD(P)-dependent oxidoreductase [Caldilineaceae bacterium SB0662_bin_25]